jgi:hypothetical protein
MIDKITEMLESLKSCANCKEAFNFNTEQTEENHFKTSFVTASKLCGHCQEYSNWEFDGKTKAERWEQEL